MTYCCFSYIFSFSLVFYMRGFVVCDNWHTKPRGEFTGNFYYKNMYKNSWSRLLQAKSIVGNLKNILRAIIFSLPENVKQGPTFSGKIQILLVFSVTATHTYHLRKFKEWKIFWNKYIWWWEVRQIRFEMKNK